MRLCSSSGHFPSVMWESSCTSIKTWYFHKIYTMICFPLKVCFSEMLIVISPVVLDKYLGFHLSRYLPVQQVAFLQAANRMQCGAYTAVVLIHATACNSPQKLKTCFCHLYVISLSYDTNHILYHFEITDSC